jgi:hypothetical protein
VLVLIQAQRGVLPHSRSGAGAHCLEHSRIIEVYHRHAAVCCESAQNRRLAHRPGAVQGDDRLLQRESSQDRGDATVNHILELSDHAVMLPTSRQLNYQNVRDANYQNVRDANSQNARPIGELLTHPDRQRPTEPGTAAC